MRIISPSKANESKMAELPTIALNSGRSMPALGMGTATHPQPPDETITAAVIAAIELGYRHFDTASVYGSERAVGRGIAAALERGLVGSRDELFVTTKLWCTDMYAHAVVPALRESLRNLGLEYVDLYLVHQPARLRGQKTFLFTHEDVLPLEDMASLREAMEECQKLGLAKSIGVSNFTAKKLDRLLQYTSIPPAVNQRWKCCICAFLLSVEKVEGRDLNLQMKRPCPEKRRERDLPARRQLLLPHCSRTMGLRARREAYRHWGPLPLFIEYLD